ncbi:DUF3316 domain-containing protein [Vibrio alfacsensis]|uniref:DUF3316 domain-containing protein n=1 Tax=Vibrio alfacsensis TaxID=1074311 RepID=UPI004068307D
MKRIITLASLIALTMTPATVLAGGFFWTSNTETISGDVVDSRQAAYDLGFGMIKDYQNMSSNQLREEFTNPFDYVDRKSFSITNSKVTVDEFLKGNGQIVYQPVLSVKYKYRMRVIGNR